MRIEETNENEPLMKHRKCELTSKRRNDNILRGSTGTTCLLPVWCPVFRWRELYSGLYKEQEKQQSDGKRKGTILAREAEVSKRVVVADCIVVAQRSWKQEGAKDAAFSVTQFQQLAKGGLG